MNSAEKEKLCRKFSEIFHIDDQPLIFSNKIKSFIKTYNEKTEYIDKAEMERQMNLLTSEKFWKKRRELYYWPKSKNDLIWYIKV